MLKIDNQYIRAIPLFILVFVLLFFIRKNFIEAYYQSEQVRRYQFLLDEIHRLTDYKYKGYYKKPVDNINPQTKPQEAIKDDIDITNDQLKQLLKDNNFVVKDKIQNIEDIENIDIKKEIDENIQILNACFKKEDFLYSFLSHKIFHRRVFFKNGKFVASDALSGDKTIDFCKIFEYNQSSELNEIVSVLTLFKYKHIKQVNYIDSPSNDKVYSIDLFDRQSDDFKKCKIIKRIFFDYKDNYKIKEIRNYYSDGSIKEEIKYDKNGFMIEKYDYNLGDIYNAIKSFYYQLDGLTVLDNQLYLNIGTTKYYKQIFYNPDGTIKEEKIY